MPQVENQGATLHYEIAGDGPPLLLVAGIASDMASWGPLPPLLAGRRLILLDNRGSGRTRAGGPLGIDGMADDCAALLAHLGEGPVDVVGHSMGGVIGLALAATAPHRVKRLVTMASGTIAAPARVLLRDMARLYPLLPPEDWFRLLYQWLFSPAFFADEANVAAAAAASAAYPWRQSPSDFARQVAAIDGFSGFDAAAIRCPVLAIAAGNDLLAPPAAVAALHAGIAGVEFVTIPGAAHSVHWEKPAEIAAALAGFLR